MHHIPISVIQFADGENPLPYVPAFAEWTDHVAVCVQCAHVDQIAQRTHPGPQETEHLFSLLCEGGAQLQTTVSKRIDHQHEISLSN